MTSAVLETDKRVAKGTEIRAYVPVELKRLIKAIAGVKNTNRDWTISDIVEEALREWLKKPENQELIQRHNFEQPDD